ncbi:MAG: MFS transporter [Planctomycetes bacterium]|nr:MFS transporter [Planctomycetota bacterium]
MAFQQAGSLNNRTFIGLIVAQFLAGFNDQAIHASAMFFAIHQGILSQEQAITLMPVLFYAPWAIFCTLSGYLADRYSKTYSLIGWKISEIIIGLIALGGFYLGAVHHESAGAWMVMSTVFLMGTHAAFFAPAKYGAMPEILQPHILSRGNGILESTTFLAAILGTVSGGLLSFVFRGQEAWIGVVLVILGLIGAGASFLIAYLPAACPERPFPANLFKPLQVNLGVLFRSKPLALSVLGIAFFIFMVSYMRATMYMHGETRAWSEFETSLVVATVALGVGLGSPLAGYLSGGKVELGLVPLGCFGMFAATLLAAFEINHTAALVIALILMGFFSGFYMVPLYTLLQHRAPKTSKGELVATSNFINVTGAIAASVLFGFLVWVGKATGITPLVPQSSGAEGTLIAKEEYTAGPRKGRLKKVVIKTDDDEITYRSKTEPPPLIDFPEDENDDEAIREYLEAYARDLDVIEYDANFFEIFGPSINLGDRVAVSQYQLRGRNHYKVRLTDQALKPRYDSEGLPKYLFFGAALMTLGILILLVRKLPDFLVRTLFWARSLGRFKLRATGMQHLPTSGPVLLASNCDRLENSLQLISATDRYTTVVLTDPACDGDWSILSSLARRSSLVLLSASSGLETAEDRARAAFSQGNMLALGIDGQVTPELAKLFDEFRGQAPLVPVFCGAIDQGERKPRIRVVFGEVMNGDSTLEDLRERLRVLAESVRKHDDTIDVATH